MTARLRGFAKPTAFKLALAISLFFCGVRLAGYDSSTGDTPVLATIERALFDLHFIERQKLGAARIPS
ncbi:MAG: hypothetical protein ACYCWW_10420, partial [Deltaproteobacteria bacterium]